MSAPSAPTIRRFVLTGSIAAITAMGAWYGAGLKTQREYKQEKKVALEATPEERTEQLCLMRKRLVARKEELERKIAELSGTAADVYGSGGGGRERRREG